jgi:hypothetical protein
MDLYWALGVRGRILVATGRIKEANAQASELLAMLVERGAPLTAPDSSGDLAVVLQALGRATDFQGLAQTWTATPWRQAATAIAAGDFKQAADLYAQIGSRPDEAFAHSRRLSSWWRRPCSRGQRAATACPRLLPTGQGQRLPARERAVCVH